MSIRDRVSALVRPRHRAKYLRFEANLSKYAQSLGLASVARQILIRKYLAKPYEVDIEVTSICDADCIMCPRRAMRRKQGPMDFALFRKIVDEAVELGVHELALNGYGRFLRLGMLRIISPILGRRAAQSGS